MKPKTMFLLIFAVVLLTVMLLIYSRAQADFDEFSAYIDYVHACDTHFYNSMCPNLEGPPDSLVVGFDIGDPNFDPWISGYFSGDVLGDLRVRYVTFSPISIRTYFFNSGQYICNTVEYLSLATTYSYRYLPTCSYESFDQIQIAFLTKQSNSGIAYLDSVEVISNSAAIYMPILKKADPYP